MADSTNRSSVIVRMPSALKRRLARETARRGDGLNDLAVGILGRRFDVPVQPTGRRSVAPGASGVVVLRMPRALKRRISDEATIRATSTNDLIVRTLADELGADRKEPMAKRNGT